MDYFPEKLNIFITQFKEIRLNFEHAYINQYDRLGNMSFFDEALSLNVELESVEIFLAVLSKEFFLMLLRNKKLEKLLLSDCDFDIKDMEFFLRNQSGSLKVLAITRVKPHQDDELYMIHDEPLFYSNFEFRKV